MLDELKELGQRVGFEMDLDLTLRLAGLILARFLGAGLSLPFMGGKMIPGRIKFGIPLVFTVFLYPVIAPSVDPARVPALGLSYAALVAKEVFVGYCLGFVAALPFFAIEVAGNLMDTQRGTTFAQVIAPALGGMSSLLAQFYTLLFIAIFLGMDGNHMVIEAIGRSFRLLPVVEWPPALHPESPFVVEVIRHGANVFLIGLQIAAPVVVAMLLTDVTLGVVNRAAPNIQVFWVGMPIKALGGLAVVFFALGYASDLFARMAVDTGVALQRAVVLLAGKA